MVAFLAVLAVVVPQHRHKRYYQLALYVWHDLTPYGARKGYRLKDIQTPGRVMSLFLKREAEQNEQIKRG